MIRINIPEPDVVLKRIKQAIENNQWSTKELDNFLEDICIWRDEEYSQ